MGRFIRLERLPRPIATRSSSETAPALLLEHAAKGKGLYPQYVTAYQILDRLPVTMRDTLIKQHGDSGAGAGDWSSAAKHIANLIKGMGGIETSYFDTRGVEFRVGGKRRQAGYKVCGLYRLIRP